MDRSFTADCIVVGSGPGGATVARALARRGRRVLILERGGDHRRRPYYGTYLGALIYADRGSLLYAREGMQIVRPLMVGGATSMYCGCAAAPPEWLIQRYGIDCSAEVEETWAELGVAPLPESLRGAASTRLAQAGRALGYAWEPQPKLMTIDHRRFACSAACMLGCRCGAKWSAGSYVDQAVAAGATLLTSAHVTRVRIAGRRVTGVEGRIGGARFVAHADMVVLAAGGIGTPRILCASGIAGAGEGLTVDATLMVYGMTAEPGIGHEPPMTWAWRNDADGYMLSTLIDPWLMYPLAVAPAGIGGIRTWARWGNLLGVMIKIKDDPAGIVTERSISKPATSADRERLALARGVAERILQAAGASPASLVTTALRGTHPGGTARIGRLVDTRLQTEIAGLSICDASVFPEALGQPTVITIISLAKRLAADLAGGHSSGLSLAT